jgi:transcriptional repressor BetI
MGEIRRRELIAATIATIHDEGFHDATVARIARRAGLSTGIVHHYFRDKDDLLEATMRALGASLGEEITARLAAASTPRERIYAVIDGNFSATQFTRQGVIAWLAFWAVVPFSERLARIQRVIYGRLRSNLMHAMRLIAPAERAGSVVVGLITHIDGLWLRAALDKDRMEPAQARAVARDFFDRLLPPTEQKAEARP